jgi:hypothetical protein
MLGFQQYLAPDDPAGGRMAAEVIRTLLPVIESSGLAGRDEIDIDTLADRITALNASSGALFKPPALVGCWATVE